MLFVLMISKVTLQGKTFTNPTDLFEYLLNSGLSQDYLTNIKQKGVATPPNNRYSYDTYIVTVLDENNQVIPHTPSLFCREII